MMRVEAVMNTEKGHCSLNGILKIGLNNTINLTNMDLLKEK